MLPDVKLLICFYIFSYPAELKIITVKFIFLLEEKFCIPYFYTRH